MKIPDLLRRLGATFTWPTTERRTVFVHNDDPWYELYYDGRAQAVLEYRGLDGRIIQQPLTREQEKEFLRSGPEYIAGLYRAAAPAGAKGDAPAFPPAVAQQLQRDYPEVTRWIAAKHLARYDAGRPHQARVQRAVLRIAGGNVHAVKTWIDRALIDYRWALRHAGDVDTAAPLPPGKTGIDPASGAIIATEGSLVPSLTKSAFLASALFAGERFSPGEFGEEILIGAPVTLAGVMFHPALRFDAERLIEVWLEGSDAVDPRAWLDTHLPGWQQGFMWGTVEAEGGDGSHALVVQFTAPPPAPAKPLA